MRFGFDANILMAILIGGRAFHKVILQTFDVITPDFALTEIDKYHKVITEKSELGWLEHMQFAHVVFFSRSCPSSLSNRSRERRKGKSANR